MTSPAYDRLFNGYWNEGLFSPANPGGFSGPGAVRENWSLMLQDVALVIGEGSASAKAALDAAQSAFGAPSSRSTCVTPITIPALDALVTVPIVEDDRIYSEGQTAVVAVAGDGAKQFSGPIKTWNPVTKQMQVLARYVSGAGNFSNWRIALTAPVDETLSGRVAALETANSKFRAKAMFAAKEIIA